MGRAGKPPAPPAGAVAESDWAFCSFLAGGCPIIGGSPTFL